VQNQKKQIEEVPIVFQDGVKTKITYFRTSRNEIPTIILPAMGIRGSYYYRLGNEIQKKGFPVIIMDYRGYGLSSVRASREIDFGFREWLSDLHFAIKIFRNRFSIDKINLLGHSIGGQLACLFAARHPEIIGKVVLVGSGLPYYKTWKGWGKLKLWIGGNLSKFISNAVGYFPGELTGFAGRESRSCMQDWSKIVKTGKYKIKNDSFNYELAMSSVLITIQAISFPEDNLAPPYTTNLLLDKFQASIDKNHKVIEGFDHFNWTKNPLDFLNKSNIFYSDSSDSG